MTVSLPIKWKSSTSQATWHTAACNAHGFLLAHGSLPKLHLMGNMIGSVRNASLQKAEYHTCDNHYTLKRIRKDAKPRYRQQRQLPGSGQASVGQLLARMHSSVWPLGLESTLWTHHITNFVSAKLQTLTSTAKGQSSLGSSTFCLLSVVSLSGITKRVWVPLKATTDGKQTVGDAGLIDILPLRSPSVAWPSKPVLWWVWNTDSNHNVPYRDSHCQSGHVGHSGKLTSLEDS